MQTVGCMQFKTLKEVISVTFRELAISSEFGIVRWGKYSPTLRKISNDGNANAIVLSVDKWCHHVADDEEVEVRLKGKEVVSG